MIVFPGWWALAPTMGTLLLISSGPSGWINAKVLSMRPIVFVGLVSYPLYLWHWPLLTLAHVLLGQNVSFGITVGVIFLAAILSVATYKFIELPIRHSTPSIKLTAGLCASMATCGVVGGLLFSETLSARSQSYDVGRFVRAATEDWLPNRNAMPGDIWVRWAHWTVAVAGLVYVGSAPKCYDFRTQPRTSI
jgi:peptidoglycan/LPS O-acetylase OafA/YrhL